MTDNKHKPKASAEQFHAMHDEFVAWYGNKIKDGWLPSELSGSVVIIATSIIADNVENFDAGLQAMHIAIDTLAKHPKKAKWWIK